MSTLNRRIARAVVPFLAQLPITPNHVTLVSLAFGLVAAGCFARGPDGWVWGALWLQAAYVLDNCDGELARRQGTSSGFGSWLDTVVDCVVHMAFFWALAAGLDDGGGLWFAVGGVTAVGVFLSYAMAFAAQVHARGADAWRHPDPPAGSPPPRSAWVRFRKRWREDFSWIILGAALAGHMAWLVVAGLLSSFAIAIDNLRTVLGPARGATEPPVGPTHDADRRVGSGHR
jgi:phosphatidylglycerophosphate synthase